MLFLTWHLFSCPYFYNAQFIIDSCMIFFSFLTSEWPLLGGIFLSILSPGICVDLFLVIMYAGSFLSFVRMYYSAWDLSHDLRGMIVFAPMLLVKQNISFNIQSPYDGPKDAKMFVVMGMFIKHWRPEKIKNNSDGFTQYNIKLTFIKAIHLFTPWLRLYTYLIEFPYFDVTISEYLFARLQEVNVGRELIDFVIIDQLSVMRDQVFVCHMDRICNEEYLQQWPCLFDVHYAQVDRSESQQVLFLHPDRVFVPKQPSNPCMFERHQSSLSLWIEPILFFSMENFFILKRYSVIEVSSQVQISRNRSIHIFISNDRYSYITLRLLPSSSIEERRKKYL